MLVSAVYGVSCGCVWVRIVCVCVCVGGCWRERADVGYVVFWLFVVSVWYMCPIVITVSNKDPFISKSKGLRRKKHEPIFLSSRYQS